MGSWRQKNRKLEVKSREMEAEVQGLVEDVYTSDEKHKFEVLKFIPFLLFLYFFLFTYVFPHVTIHI